MQQTTTSPVSERASDGAHDVPLARPPVSRRTIGLIAVAVGTAVVVASVLAVVLGWRLIGSAADSVGDTLEISASLVETVDDTISVADIAVDQAAAGLGTIQDALAGTDETIRTASTVMADTAELVGTDIPNGIDAVRETMPALIRSAELIDGALGALSFAGIDFAPQPPPQESLSEVDDGLAEVAAKLRAASAGLAQIGDDFDTVGGDVGSITGNLEGIVQTLDETDTLLDDYRATTGGAAELVAETQTELMRQAADARVLLVLIAAILGLGQIVPIGAGVMLLRNDVYAAPGPGTSGQLTN